MTPDKAKAYAQDIIDVNAQINSSYVANGHIAQSAAVAAIVIDMATQLEAAQTELVVLKSKHVESLPTEYDRPAEQEIDR